jgi:hypothetical protein
MHWFFYCCPTAAKLPVERAGHSTFLLFLQVKKRADERTRTDYPCSSYELDLSSSTEAEKSLTYRQNYPHSIVVLPSITSGLV